MLSPVYFLIETLLRRRWKGSFGFLRVSLKKPPPTPDRASHRCSTAEPAQCTHHIPCSRTHRALGLQPRVEEAVSELRSGDGNERAFARMELAWAVTGGCNHQRVTAEGQTRSNHPCFEPRVMFFDLLIFVDSYIHRRILRRSVHDVMTSASSRASATGRRNDRANHSNQPVSVAIYVPHPVHHIPTI